MINALSKRAIDHLTIVNPNTILEMKQRIELFAEDFEEKKTLIHDNALQFTSIDYSWYGIKGVNICTSAPKGFKPARRETRTLTLAGHNFVAWSFASSLPGYAT